MLDSGKILIAGGQNANVRAWIGSAELLDPATGESKRTGAMKGMRASHTATRLVDGRVLVTGGHNESMLNSAEIYDEATGKFTSTGAMAVKRCYHTATTLEDGTVLIVGGGEGAGAAELYDPQTGKFKAVGKTALGRVQHAAVRLDNGKVLIVGGLNDQDARTPSATAEIYDPSTRKFTATGSMKVARYNHSATLLANGKVLVLGGCNGKDSLDSAEIFDPAKGAFRQLSNRMQVPRETFTAHLLSDERVLVTGGSTGSGMVEAFDVDSESFKELGATERRVVHTANLLEDGRVLLAGGYNGSEVLSSIEYVETGVLPGGQNQPPLITTHPLSQSAKVGGKVTFAVVANGKKLSYQWYRGTEKLSGANASRYTIQSVAAEDNGAEFWVEVSNPSGNAFSESAVLTVKDDGNASAPSIARFDAQPATIKNGQKTTLEAVFTGGEGLLNPGFVPIKSGEPMILVPSATTNYVLTVTNGAGQSVTSNLTVTVMP